MTDQQIITFDQTGTFKAYYEACEWCKQNGFSVGSMARDMPIGIHRGECDIAKWYNLTQAERDGLDGYIECDSNFRESPVRIVLRNKKEEFDE